MSESLLPKSIICYREGFTREQVISDLWAGLTVGIVALPLAMAFGIASGVTPDRGLFTAIVAGFLISLLGGSRVQIGGPTGAFIVIVYGVVQQHGYDGLVLATLMAGVLLIILGLARLGTMIKYIPYPVITGFTAGIALIIASSQIKEFLGLPIEKLPADFIGQWGAYLQALTSVHLQTVVLGLSSLALLIVLRVKWQKLPGPIVAVTFFSVLAWLFDLNVATIGSKFGGIPSSLPTPEIPTFSLAKMREVGPAAITIALLAGIESLLSAVVADGMTGYRHKSNTELVAQGVANIGSVVFGGIPATGAIARTATNVRSGAKTPIAGMFHAITLLLFMFFLAPLANYIPLATLSAVLLLVAWNMSEMDKFKRMFRAPRSDTVLMLIVFVLTVFLDLTVAVQVGVVGAALMFMKRMSEVDDAITSAQIKEDLAAAENEGEKDWLDKREIPQDVEVYEVNGPLFFGVADRMKDTLKALRRPPKVLILRMRRVPDMDATGLYALEELAIKCRKQGTILVLSGIRPSLRGLLKENGFDQIVGDENIHSHIRLALQRASAIASQNVAPDAIQVS